MSDSGRFAIRRKSNSSGWREYMVTSIEAGVEELRNARDLDEDAELRAWDGKQWTGLAKANEMEFADSDVESASTFYKTLLEKRSKRKA
jgi:hypothetical protein